MNYKELYRDNNQKYIGQVLSFGAGVQSTALFLLLRYEPEKILKEVGFLPEHIIFADTGAEKKEALAMFEKCKKETNIPMYRVKNWKTNALTSPTSIPVFLETGGFNRQRKCTTDWKVRVVRRAITKLYPKKKGDNPVGLWLGISIDEISRMRVSDIKSVQHIYPLIDMNLDRQDCYNIIDKYGWEKAKSACYMCPFQSQSAWTNNKEIDKAIEYELRLQAVSKYDSKPYLTKFRQPLSEVKKELGTQQNLFSFDDECTGYCGV